MASVNVQVLKDRAVDTVSGSFRTDSSTTKLSCWKPLFEELQRRKGLQFF